MAGAPASERLRFKEPRWLGEAPTGAHVRLSDGRVVPFPSRRGYLLLGRGATTAADAAVDVVVDEPSVAELHAAVAFHREHRRPFLIDLGVGRTRVAGKAVEAWKPTPVPDGGAIELGEADVRVQVHLRAAEDPHAGDKRRATESSVGREGARVRARHILIKHRDVRNPVSRRTGEAVWRTPAEARQLLERVRERIVRHGESFERVAQAESDCSSYKRGGDLGWFAFAAMQRPFSEAAFEMLDAPGDISGIVETASGFHLIQLIDRKPRKPPSACIAPEQAAFLRNLFGDAPPPTPQPNAPLLTVRQILLKHAASRNPVTPDGQAVTRSREEARASLGKLREAIVTGAVPFDEAALQHSECRSARYGGKVRPFHPGDMHPEFESAALGLERGAISGIVDTPSGCHLIQLLERADEGGAAPVSGDDDASRRSGS
ncbi:hypothetical protein CDCA_CDCA12G3548 [Cyanidium caldarium]|uniref:peptidylprolyl isomerase n=1 Tax=Cyanidium caldarium TaxID=2771 RepID=A0AAV9IYW5_CYACA|nr:hypothetical protein CDCA_CDCA12G3548 [Cyanidium caldarium]